jgi:hypothetical protein
MGGTRSQGRAVAPSVPLRQGTCESPRRRLLGVVPYTLGTEARHWRRVFAVHGPRHP